MHSSLHPSQDTQPADTGASGKVQTATAAPAGCAGWAADESTQQRGFLEDMQVGCELAVTAVFDCARGAVRRLLAIPRDGASDLPAATVPLARRRTRSSSYADEVGRRISIWGSPTVWCCCMPCGTAPDAWAGRVWSGSW
jgi:hypothetical protein